MTDDPAGPVIDPPGSSRAEQPPPYQWITPNARRLLHSRGDAEAGRSSRRSLESLFQRRRSRGATIRPILWFGDSVAYSNSDVRVVTVGLNPSRVEFPEGDRFFASRTRAC
jgi:hypothetical protein